MGVSQSILKFDKPKKVVAGVISDGTNYGVPFFTLEVNNHLGHNFRFCGITGGYTDGSAYFDVNGVSTTRALAFPEDLMCEFSSLDKDGNFVMFSIDTTLAVSTWASAITTCNGYSTTSFPSGFTTPTTFMLDKIFYPITLVFLNQKPFESALGVSVWSLSEATALTAYAHRSNMQRTPLTKTTAITAKPLPVRVTNISEL